MSQEKELDMIERDPNRLNDHVKVGNSAHIVVSIVNTTVFISRRVYEISIDPEQLIWNSMKTGWSF